MWPHTGKRRYTNVLTLNGLKRQLAVSHRQSAVSNPLVNIRRFHQTVRWFHQTVRRFQQTVSGKEKALEVTLYPLEKFIIFSINSLVHFDQR